MKEFEVTTADAGMRADVFVAARYGEFTRSSLEGLFDEGKVTVAGRPVKPSYKVRQDDKVAIDEEPIRRRPESIDLPVIYEDDGVLVIDKPAGVLTHSKGALNDEATVASFINGRLEDNTLTGNRAGIVHRLDRHTSGVIITGKTADAVRQLQKQFSQRKVKKVYIAVVEGVPEPQEAIIDAPLMRNPRKPQTFIVSEAGKTAVTKYKTIKVFKRNDKEYSLLQLTPQTGRTHQLRVHLAYIRHPIVGDSVYGKGDGPMMLHAFSLELALPGGEQKIFESPMPPRMKEFAVL